ncbi:DUF624 domain-containing protein [Plantactinospora sp. CA-290183]|uniref:DUF624 domain-containing protein n=1 Tax=Plantactinospora sp. CA-290183 TaxID=3240006 RepID=UPI003D92A2FF
MSSAAASRQFGEGPLSRAVALIYRLLVVELLFLLTAVPGIVPLVLLDRDPSNLPLAAACALPLGPAISAALYALHRHRGDLADLHPAAEFWRGYRANFRPVLGIWIPWLGWLTVAGLGLAHLDAVGLPGWWAVLLVLAAVWVTLWAANALLITTLFTFRVRDVARLAFYFLVRTRGVTLGNACLLVVATGITALTSEAVLALLGSVLALLLLRTGRPMTNAIQEEFTA